MVRKLNRDTPFRTTCPPPADHLPTPAKAILSSVKPSYRQIADLFGLPIPDEAALPPEDDILSLRRRIGQTGQESRDMGFGAMVAGRYEEAVEHFKRAVEQDGPDSAEAKISLGEALEAMGHAPQALRQFLEAQRAHASDRNPYLALADLYRRHGRFKQSIENLHRAVEATPDDAYCHFKLAEALDQSGHPTHALAAIQGAIAVEPTDAFYHYWMGNLLIRLNRYDQALAALQAAIELSPGDDHFFVRAAVAFWGAGKRAEAIRALRLATDLAPDNASHQVALAMLLERDGQLVEASEARANLGELDRYDQDTVSRLEIELDEAESAKP